MDDDERKIHHWLLAGSKCIETFYITNDGKRHLHLSYADARKEMVLLLRSARSLHAYIRNALANAFEAQGSSKARLELVLVRRAGRGRPRKCGVKDAVESQKLAGEGEAAIEVVAAVKGKRTRNLAIGDTAKKKGVSSRSVRRAMSARNRAREIGS